MGQRRRHRDDEWAARAQLRAADEGDRRTECLQRWPGIVGAIRRLIAAYNDGAGVEVLTIAQRSDDDPSLIVTSQQAQGAFVTIAVDDGDLSVRLNGTPRGAAGPHGGERRIDCSRSDLGTAAYLLQEWMDQISLQSSRQP